MEIRFGEAYQKYELMVPMFIPRLQTDKHTNS
jgi:protein-S-isoprenylcysteine O-methyltransferase Ste14